MPDSILFANIRCVLFFMLLHFDFLINRALLKTHIGKNCGHIHRMLKENNAFNKSARIGL